MAKKEVYKCDRCNKERIIPWFVHIERKLIIFSNFIGRERIKQYDLCNDCKEKLEKWLKEGADNG